eukprot:CCRYP_014901-RC/>CCRYP_014901-RC protein AED:0.05 eAED:0.05 QI:379/1/1/1/1/1/3/174/487
MFRKTFLLLAYSIQAAFAFAHLSHSAGFSSLSSVTANRDHANGTHPALPQLLPNQVKERVHSGRVYVQHDFLTADQLKFLQRDMHRLDQEGKFVVNGLSDVRKGLKGETTLENDASTSAYSRANQGFDVKYDRSVCPTPWWQQSLSLVDDSSLEFECHDATDQDAATLHSIQLKLQRLRRDLADILDRPTMLDSSLGHECYYSKSKPGSSLARHMDERHEESKGPRGWLLPSRRSLSWLIYLSETEESKTYDENYGSNINNKEWDAEQNGGMLRTFPQKYFRPKSNIGCEDTVPCGSHNGNLQVGWLLAEEHESFRKYDESLTQITHPVFLDCWYQHTNPYTRESEPHGVLYIVRQQIVGEVNTTSSSNEKQIEYITVPWLPFAFQGNVMEFLKHRATLELNPEHSSERLFLDQNYASQFKLLEDRETWESGKNPAGSVVEDILPKRGTLVVFDSVALPHEVTPVIEGSRSALAGWFHEETQPFGGK